VKRRTETFGRRDSSPASRVKAAREAEFDGIRWNINAYEGMIALVLNLVMLA
jgi:hypothetical protein